jgi:hypothetical protein
VEALVHVPEAATLTVLGGWDEGEESRLRELAERHGVAARVTFRGQRSRADVHAAYADADLVVFPVRWEEPWGLVPLEAMARGRPVVATGRGGSGEYLREGGNRLPRATRPRVPRMRERSAALELSVIVPVRNGADSLPPLLRSLEAQTLDRERFEVIVVDNDSSDGTGDAALADHLGRPVGGRVVDHPHLRQSALDLWL